MDKVVFTEDVYRAYVSGIKWWVCKAVKKDSDLLGYYTETRTTEVWRSMDRITGNYARLSTSLSSRMGKVTHLECIYL
jgi:hypothetical protein